MSPLRSKLPAGGVSIFAVMTRLANELGAINLSQGFPDFDCDPELVESVARYMREGHNQYTPMAGVLALREALAMKVERIYGRRYDPHTEITVTSGGTEGLFATLTALVHPGDEVVLFQPAYDSYVPAVQLSGGRPVFVTLRPPDYRIDWDAVRRAITPRTRVIVVNSPHNPTGMIWTPEDVGELERVLAGTDAVVVADEVYEHIIFDGARHESLSRYPAIAERAVVISSFGKTHTTTGWKVGYCLAPPALTAEIQRVHQWIVFAVNGAVQMAFADAVRRDPTSASVTSFYQRKRDLFLSLLEGSRFRPLACRGTFFQLVDYSAITDEPGVDFAVRLTREHGVASIPIAPFLHEADPGPVIRFCFAKRDETLTRAAERLRSEEYGDRIDRIRKTEFGRRIRKTDSEDGILGGAHSTGEGATWRVRGQRQAEAVLVGGRVSSPRLLMPLVWAMPTRAVVLPSALVSCLLSLDSCVSRAAAASASAAVQAALPDERTFLETSRENLARSQRQQNRYAYRERRTEVHTNPFGRLGTGATLVYDIRPGEESGVWYRRLLEREGMPVQDSPEEKLDRRGRSDRRNAIDDVVATLDFRLERREMVDGHPVIRVAFTPKRDAKPQTREGRMAKLFKGAVLIDEAAHEVIRVEAVAVDDMSYGLGIVARLNEGATVTVERRRIDESVWLPTLVHIVGQGRAMLVRKLAIDFSVSWSDYRRP